jgi:hypothetical protein
MAKTYTQTQAKGALLGLLQRLGFATEPHVNVVDPGSITEADLRPGKTITIDGKTFGIAKVTPTTRGLHGHEDFFLDVSHGGKSYRLYLARGGQRFIDAYYQLASSKRIGPITIVERT